MTTAPSSSHAGSAQPQPASHRAGDEAVAEPRDTSPVVSMRDVELAFAGVKALQGVDLDVHPGELFAVIGPNGAGKTSIFNVLSGVYRPQRGSVTFGGQEIIGLKPHRIAGLGMARTFQNIELFANLDVVDNLMLGRHHALGYGWPSAVAWLGRARRSEIRNRREVEEIIDFLEIESYRHLPVGMLPYGVQKRIELGRALAMDPRLLLLDEPVAGMNGEETEDMARFILEVRSELGIAMVLVEHDMGLVMDLADRVMAMDFGKPITTGTPREVQDHPGVVAAYLGVGDEVPGGTTTDQPAGADPEGERR